MAVTREEVIYAYRFILNRDPEGESAIEWHMQTENWASLRDTLMGSDEYRYKYGYLNRWMVAPIFSDSMLIWINLKDKYVSMHCAMDSYEIENTNIMKKLLSPGDIFLDLGANVGWFSMLASSIVGEAGHVYSFEPQPTIAHYLSRTIALNHLESQITLHRAGVWREAGTMALAWAEDAENHGASHLLPLAALTPESTVRLIAIDDLKLPRCDVIKMDIEGAEPMAMEGADNTLAQQRPIILSELNGNQLKAVSKMACRDYIGAMNARNYLCVETRGEAAGKIIDTSNADDQRFTDVLFVPAEKLEWVRRQIF